MHAAIRKRLRSIAMLAVAAALVVAGVAAAQGGSEGGSGGGREGNAGKAHGGPPPGPPAMGIAMSGLTYAELHVKNKEGDEETIRVDQGKVKSVGTDSIVLTENDGSEATVKVDDDTQVMAGKPGEESSLDDLEAGQQVSASGPEGGAARVVMVMPKKGDFSASFQGGPIGPPPGVEAGTQSSTSRGPALQSSGSSR